MRENMSKLLSSSMVRDYSLASIALVILSVVGVRSFDTFMDSMRHSIRVETAQIQRQEPAPRNYTIMRSVLDDTVATGSIGSNRPVVLDPCTGQVKSK